jgi:hypothetical protein
MKLRAFRRMTRCWVGHALVRAIAIAGRTTQQTLAVSLPFPLPPQTSPRSSPTSRPTSHTPCRSSTTGHCRAVRGPWSVTRDLPHTPPPHHHTIDTYPASRETTPWMVTGSGDMPMEICTYSKSTSTRSSTSPNYYKTNIMGVIN